MRVDTGQYHEYIAALCLPVYVWHKLTRVVEAIRHPVINFVVVVLLVLFVSDIMYASLLFTVSRILFLTPFPIILLGPMHNPYMIQDKKTITARRIVIAAAIGFTWHLSCIKSLHAANDAIIANLKTAVLHTRIERLAKDILTECSFRLQLTPLALHKKQCNLCSFAFPRTLLSQYAPTYCLRHYAVAFQLKSITTSTGTPHIALHGNTMTSCKQDQRA
eukprot:3311782-Pleurochrysis_carterae.AAC.1